MPIRSRFTNERRNLRLENRFRWHLNYFTEAAGYTPANEEDFRWRVAASAAARLAAYAQRKISPRNDLRRTG